MELKEAGVLVLEDVHAIMSSLEDWEQEARVVRKLAAVSDVDLQRSELTARNIPPRSKQRTKKHTKKHTKQLKTMQPNQQHQRTTQTSLVEKDAKDMKVNVFVEHSCT